LSFRWAGESRGARRLHFKGARGLECRGARRLHCRGAIELCSRGAGGLECRGAGGLSSRRAGGAPILPPGTVEGRLELPAAGGPARGGVLPGGHGGQLTELGGLLGGLLEERGGHRGAGDDGGPLLVLVFVRPRFGLFFNFGLLLSFRLLLHLSLLLHLGLLPAPGPVRHRRHAALVQGGGGEGGAPPHRCSHIGAEWRGFPVLNLLGEAS